MAKRRFAASFDSTIRDLCSTLVKMDARCRIDFGGDLFKYEAQILKTSGIGHNRFSDFLPDDGVRITFWRGGVGYAYQCCEWGDYRDNLRACQRTISGQYQAFEDYRVTKPGVAGGFDALFGGFLLLGDGKREWHEVLGVARGASIEEVKRAYIARAKAVHPDKISGTIAGWTELQSAYDQAMAEFARMGVR